ncbi:MAG: N-acetylmannosamine-6-phosphate 2-epimerase [Propioniciclava sp.]
MTADPDLLAQLAGGLVVSCQARVDNPLHGPRYMSAMAQAAELGGAAGIRAEGAADVSAIKREVRLPIIGIRKDFAAGEVYLTPTLDDALEVWQAGADIIALDATDRPRISGWPASRLITEVRQACGCPVMADIDSLASGIAAAEAGAALVATTLSGYTGGPTPDEADYELIEQLAAREIRVVAEGRIRTGGDARRAFDAGAYAVVIGTAITNPWRITERIISSLGGDY